MLKYALLAGAMTIAAPALAQTATPTTTSPDTTAQAAAGQQAPVQDPATTAPAGDPATAATTQADPSTTASAAQPATSGAAAGGTQVAQVVDTEFPTYDKDGDGNLSQTEFGAWMVALKTASDPSTKATAAETKSWVGAAFAQADKDKSKKLSKTELTGFLSQGQS